MDTYFSISAAMAAGADAGAAAAVPIAQSYMMQTQNATPTTGQTVALTGDNKDRTLVLAPAGSLLALTITFPADGVSRIGQVVRITSSQAIVALGLTAGVTVLGIATALLANECFSYQKTAANTWKRI